MNNSWIRAQLMVLDFVEGHKIWIFFRLAIHRFLRFESPPQHPFLPHDGARSTTTPPPPVPPGRLHGTVGPDQRPLCHASAGEGCTWRHGDSTFDTSATHMIWLGFYTILVGFLWYTSGPKEKILWVCWCWPQCMSSFGRFVHLVSKMK